MTLVDSSGWVEFFSGGPRAAPFLTPLEKVETVVTPTIVLYEVFKRMRQRNFSNEEALRKVAYMQKSRVVPLKDDLAVEAAQLALKHRLAMADAIIYATALAHHAEILTLDPDFEGLPHATVVKA